MIRSRHENRKPFAPNFLKILTHQHACNKFASGYNKRSKVEAAMSRYKRVIGDALKSRHDARRATEVAIAVKSLNRMNELGGAKFVRVA